MDLSRLAENLKNYKKNIEWQLGRGEDIANQNDVAAIEDWERWQGIGPSNLGGGAAGLAGAIKTFHGSPHRFKRFDMSKIGTGEGAQAYGHGLYFAESPSVAHIYADALGSKNQDVVNNAINNIVSLHNADTSKIRSELLSQGLPEERISPELESSIAKIVKATDPSDGSVHPSALREYESLQQLVPNEKHFYETSLEWPDPAREAVDPLSPEHFLQWDRPLSEQPEKIQEIIKTQMPESSWEKMKNSSGRDYYEHYWSGGIGGSGQPRFATQRLDAMGIPGIRYLDQGSRGAGEGTYNYVIFDDRIPKIVEINGQPVDVSNLANKLRGE